ncbi:MAG: hypothetical protein A2W03_08750 [Candidatus Aminicenantes bacterium RBG_16_63_16]|nr:MAG: hypothetical protein A2W03_08750 [Candidatus Aminicenantes bacterium RBG_16_63_16]
MKKALFLFVALVLLTSALPAQETTGEIIGRVTLEDGSPLPGVTVNLTGTVGGSRSQITSSDGRYRFLRLPPATYDLKFELEGFKTYENRAVVIHVGESLVIDTTMTPGQLEETVTVVAKVPLINTRKTNISRNVSNEELQSLPLARNALQVIELAPGVLVGQADVSGTKVGEDATSFYGQGTDMRQSRYAIDGANIEGGNYTGELGIMINVNTIEETQITTSSHDIMNTTGGVQVNFVTKRGGNRLSGSSYIYAMDKSFEMSYGMPSEFVARKQTVPQGTNGIYEWGASLGGPILKDRLWLFGSWGAKKSEIRTMLDSRIPDFQKQFYGKANFQWKNTSADFSYSNIGHDAEGWTNPTVWIATFNINEPVKVYTAQVSQMFKNLLINAKFSLGDAISNFSPYGYPVDLSSTYKKDKTFNPVGRDFTYDDRSVPPWTSYPHSINWWRYIRKYRPYYLLEANYFAEKVLGMNHEIKAGVDYEMAKEDLEWLAPNERSSRDYFRTDRTMARVLYTATPNVRYFKTPRTGLFFQDTISFKRLTATIGLRYDMYNSKWEPTTIKPWRPFGQTVTAWEPYLGGLTVPGGDLPWKFKPLTPRLSATYDLLGDGKNIIKLSLGRYMGTFSNMESAALGLRAAASFGFVVPWFDKNGNNICDLGEYLTPNPAEIRNIRNVGNAELTAWTKNHPGVAPPPYNNSYWTYPDWNYYSSSGFPNDGPPSATASTTVLDPDFKLRSVDEATLGFEREILRDFSGGITLIYKKAFNDQWTRGVYTDGHMLGPSDYEVKYTVDGKQIWGSIPYNKPFKNNYVTNYTKTKRTYFGVAFKFTKRFSDNWSAGLSYDFADWKYYPDKSEFFDYTNWDYYYGSAQAPSQYGSLRYFANSRHTVRAHALIRLPYDITFSTLITAREGFPIQQWKRLSDGSYVYFGKYGDNRLKPVWTLNLALEKAFRLTDTVRIVLMGNALNVTNNHPIIQVQQSFSADVATEILPPGLFQFGFRIHF